MENVAYALRQAKIVDSEAILKGQRNNYHPWFHSRKKCFGEQEGTILKAVSDS